MVKKKSILIRAIDRVIRLKLWAGLYFDKLVNELCEPRNLILEQNMHHYECTLWCHFLGAYFEPYKPTLNPARVDSAGIRFYPKW